MKQNLLDIRNLTIALPDGSDRRHAVQDLSLSLGHHEILCLVGESGSGKSITARAIMGLLPKPQLRIAAGSIELEGENLLLASETRLRQLRGSRMAMIFQEPMTALNPLKTVGDQIDEVIAVHVGMPRARRMERVRSLFEAVHLPDPAALVRSYPHQLSGGQRQRVMIAMALALDPALLIADEPTTALDVTTQAQILSLLKELQGKHGMGIIFVTHDFGVVSDIADRVAVLQHGKLVETGDRDKVVRDPQHDYTRNLIAAIPSLTPAPSRSFEGAAIVMSVNGLNKSYRRKGGLLGRAGATVPAVDGLDIEIRKGEIYGLIGESGSGKSTAARCIARLAEPDAGKIFLGGRDIASLPRRALRPLRNRVQMVFQDPYGSLNPRMTIGELIAEGPLVHGVPRRQADARTRDLLNLVGLGPEAIRRYPHEFSGGQRQRIGIARALALEPELLIADEAVSALDVSIQAQVLDLLRDIRDRLELSMLFITHDLRVAAQLCDSIAVMQRGVIVEHGATGRIFAAPSHSYTKELLAVVPGMAYEKARQQSPVRLASTRTGMTA